MVDTVHDEEITRFEQMHAVIEAAMLKISLPYHGLVSQV
jgi:hypothetical protein